MFTTTTILSTSWLLMLLMTMLLSPNVVWSAPAAPAPAGQGGLRKAGKAALASSTTAASTIDSTSDLWTDFIDRNLLKDGFSPPAAQIVKIKMNSNGNVSSDINKRGLLQGEEHNGTTSSSINSISFTTAAASFGSTAQNDTTGTITISLLPKDLVPLPSVFINDDDIRRSSNSNSNNIAHYYLNGVLQNSLPSTSITRTTAITSSTSISNNTSDTSPLVGGLFTSKKDPHTTIALDPITGQFKHAIRYDTRTKRTHALLPLDLKQGIFVEVTPDDFSDEKQRRFHYDDGDDHDRLVHDDFITNSSNNDHDRHMRRLQNNDFPPCQSYKTIEVALAYESQFCQFYGGTPQQAEQVVQLTVAEASKKFEQPGICTRIVLTHLEGYCDPTTDPYTHLFTKTNSVCKESDNDSIIANFQRYWLNNRDHIRRDVAHLFHGFPHSSGTVGCAWGASLCDNEYGYGVNEITYGGNNNPLFWGTLFAHEMGHSAGAVHECCKGFLMDVTMCAQCQEFSDTSIQQIKFYIDQTSVSKCLQGTSSAINLAPPILSKGSPAPTPAPAPLRTAKPTPNFNANANANNGGTTRPPGSIVLNSGNSNTNSNANANTNANSGQCRKHMELCRDTKVCCPGVQCYQGFICLDTN